MENLLLRYMENRFRIPDEVGQPGILPFLTISREFGCPSKFIAMDLVEKLNRRPGAEHYPKWKYINKEILEASAKELDLDPSRLKYLFNAEHKGILDDVLSSFSEEEARMLAMETDKKRTGLIEMLLGRNFDHAIFDLVLNCKTLGVEDVSRTIQHTMELRKMIL